MPTFWPTGRCSRMVLTCVPPRSAEMADVVISLRDPDIETGVRRHAEFFARSALAPFVAAGEFVFAAAPDAFHDFRGAGLEGERGGQHHADGFLAAVGQGKAMAHALAV